MTDLQLMSTFANDPATLGNVKRLELPRIRREVIQLERLSTDCQRFRSVFTQDLADARQALDIGTRRLLLAGSQRMLIIAGNARRKLV